MPSNKCECLDQEAMLLLLEGSMQSSCKYALFLGAGCSVSSGVPTASAMIDDWRRKIAKSPSYRNIALPVEGDRDEYATLFETLYHTPSSRRDHIEDLLSKGRPFWGYASLASLLEAQKINVILTTNFDDLIVEACYTFSDTVRPLVYHPDTSVRDFRLTSKRPTIVKLHGDYLFSSIRNTGRETSRLEDNMEHVLESVAKEYGLIVLGYAGGDDSIMLPIKKMLNDDKYFRHGLYWGVYGEKVDETISAMAKVHERFRLFKLSGFDSFMISLRKELQLKKPSILADPEKSIRSRMNNLLEMKSVAIVDEVVETERRELVSAFERTYKKEYSADGTGERPALDLMRLRRFPLGALARNAFVKQDYEEAIKLADLNYKTLKQSNEDNAKVVAAIADLIEYSKYGSMSDADLFEKYVDDSMEIFYKSPWDIVDLALRAIKMNSLDLADLLLDRGREITLETDSTSTNELYYLINKGQVQVRRGRKVDESLAQQLQVVLKNTEEDEPARYGAAVVLGEIELANQILNRLPEDKRVEIMQWPIYQLHEKLRLSRMSAE